MAVHTPGPWTISREGQTVVGPAGRLIVDSWDCDVPDDNENVANLHLITAAPDLLAAAQNAVHAIETLWNPELCDVSQDLEALRAAIRKATGQDTEPC